MGLFEEAGIILKSGEKIVKRGGFIGQIPEKVKIARAWSGALKFGVKWKKVGGELVLTNKRLIVIGAKLRYGEVVGTVIYPDLEFQNFVAVKEEQEDRFLLHLNLGTGQLEATWFEVDDSSEWIKAIKEQCSKEDEKKKSDVTNK